MTILELNQYKAIKLEIQDITERINKLEENKTEIQTDKVTGSSSIYPYVKRNFTITGIDAKEKKKRSKKLDELIRIRQEQRDMLLEKEKNIEEFISTIPESIARRIFRYCFIDGLTQEQAAQKVHLDQSVVSRKISKYIKDA